MSEHLIGVSATEWAIDKVEYWKARAIKAEQKNEEYQYLEIACEEVWKRWPLVKWNQIRNFCAHMDTIKAALDKLKK